jgi:hypothetical protein
MPASGATPGAARGCEPGTPLLARARMTGDSSALHCRLIGIFHLEPAPH